MHTLIYIYIFVHRKILSLPSSYHENAHTFPLLFFILSIPRVSFLFFSIHVGTRKHETIVLPRKQRDARRKVAQSMMISSVPARRSRAAILSNDLSRHSLVSVFFFSFGPLLFILPWTKIRQELHPIEILPSLWIKMMIMRD